MPKPILGYWSQRSLCQPIRLLLAYTKTDYEDKYYVKGAPPDYSYKTWYDAKYKLGLDFPNLPYYIDDDGLKLTHSAAILRRISRKHGLCGNTEQHFGRMDLAENEAIDFRNRYFDVTYSKNFDELKEDYLKEIEAPLKRFSEFLGSHPWFAGDQITYVDFILYEIFDQFRTMDEFCLKKTLNLCQFMDRFEALEEIKSYINSKSFLKKPLNGRQASFGNSEECFDGDKFIG